MRELRNDVTAWASRCARHEEAYSCSKGDGRNKEAEREGMRFIKLHGDEGKIIAIRPQCVAAIVHGSAEDGNPWVHVYAQDAFWIVTESYDEVMKLINEAEQRPLPFDFEGKS